MTESLPDSDATGAGRRLRRDPEHGVVAGVLSGLAARMDADPLLVRIAFVVLVVLTGGLALAAYALGWAALPGRPEARLSSGPVAGAGPDGGRRRRGRLAIGVGLLTLAVLLSFRELGLWWSDALAWPLVLAASGAALLWRQSAVSDPVAEEIGAEDRPDGRRSGQRRIYVGAFGIALVLGAALLFLSANDALGAARDAAITVVVVALALTLILAPFLWRLGRNLAAERAERIRTQERAEVAAHLHDSVLQTLTLIQKRTDEPEEIAALARRQERELRAWLVGDSGPAADGFAGALTQAAEAVEDAQRVSVDVVIVGDCSLDDRGAAVVGAAREAMTNAAKFAGSPISLYAEVGERGIETYIRDRGAGFDSAGVPAGRQGLRESIIGRMERHGGSAEINSTDSGTEIQLRIGGEG